MSDWLDAFAQAPDTALDDLLWGRADVAPWGCGDDPSDILSALFAQRNDTSDLDAALCRWLDARRREGPGQRGRFLRAYAAAFAEALSASHRIALPATQALLRQHFDEFTRIALDLSRPGWDLRYFLWLALALSQHDRSRLGLWYRLCDQAGRDFPECYEHVAFAGLCHLPQPADAPALADEVLFGLARWGRHLDDGHRDRFLTRWRALAFAHADDSDSWPERVAPLLARHPGRPFTAWWADELGLDAPRRQKAVPVPCPGKAETDEMLKVLRRRGAALPEAELQHFQRSYERYADLTGEANNLGKAFHRVGSALLPLRADWALRLAEAALARSANASYCTGLQADALTRLGRRGEAEAVLWRAVEVDFPENAHLQNELTTLLAAQGRHQEAEALARRTVEHCPADPAAVVVLAGLVAGRDRLDEAEKMLRKGCADFPENGPCHAELARVLIRRRRPAEAEPVLRRAMARLPDDEHLPAILARLLVDTGRWDEADALFRTAVDRFPQDAAIRLDYGIELVWRDRLPEAEALLADLHRLDVRGADILAGHLKTKRAGEQRQASRGKVVTPQPRSAWGDLPPFGQALRAAFLLGPGLGRDIADRQALQDEARQAVCASLQAQPNHPLVRLVAFRHGLAPRPAPADLAAYAGDGAVSLELALQAGDEDRIRALAEGPDKPVAWLAWLLADPQDFTTPADGLRRWLDAAPRPGPLSLLHHRLGALVPRRDRGSAEDFLDAFEAALDPASARALLDLVLLGMAEAEVSLASITY